MLHGGDPAISRPARFALPAREQCRLGPDRRDSARKPYHFDCVLREVHTVDSVPNSELSILLELSLD